MKNTSELDSKQGDKIPTWCHFWPVVLFFFFHKITLKILKVITGL